MWDAIGPLLFLLLAAASNCDPGEDEPFCTPKTYTCGPITPSPPYGYIAHIEAVDQLYNTTRYIEEYYHYEGQTVAVKMRSRGTYTHTIFMYPLNTAVIMRSYLGAQDHMPKVECITAEISEASPWMAGFESADGNSTLLTVAPSQALLFGSDYKYSWMNNDTVRETPCNQWDACINIPHNGTLYVQYHWSDPSRVQDMYGFTSERPIAMHMKGKVYLPNGDLRPVDMDMMYNFGLFDDNPYWDEVQGVFEVPSNVYCSGLPNEKSPPERLADSFSNRVEIAIQNSLIPYHEFASSAKVWYDYDRKLVRKDLIPDEVSAEYFVAGLNLVTAIEDYRSGVEYIIDKALGNCTTIAIPEGGYDTITDSSGHVSLKDPMMLFGLNGITNLTYYGTRYARDMPCDVWVGHLDLKFENGTLNDALMYEVYLLKSSWHEDSGGGAPLRKTPVPVLIKIQQDFTSPANLDVITDIEENIFRFEEQIPSLTVYDITPCFRGHDHIRRFQLSFPGEFRDDFDRNPVKFTTTVQESMAREVRVALIRLQRVMLEFNERDGLLYCEFTLVDQPQVDNVDFPESVGPPLQQAVANLQEAMSYLVVILYDLNYDTPGHTKLMVANSDSLQEMFENDCTPMERIPAAKQDRQHMTEPLMQLDTSKGNGAETLKEAKDEEEHPSDAIVKPKFLTEILNGEFFSKTLQGIRGLNVQSEEQVMRRKMTRSSTMYTPGDMAGMGIGMLILGLLVGIVAMMVGLRKFGLTNAFESIPMNSRRS